MSLPLPQHFFNLLCSYGFLPHIIQPTRVTENTPTVIDNIFSNNIQDDIMSANILLTLSEHFSQFVSVKREKIDLKSIKIKSNQSNQIKSFVNIKKRKEKKINTNSLNKYHIVQKATSQRGELI